MHQYVHGSSKVYACLHILYIWCACLKTIETIMIMLQNYTSTAVVFVLFFILGIGIIRLWILCGVRYEV